MRDDNFLHENTANRRCQPTEMRSSRASIILAAQGAGLKGVAK